MLVLSLLVQMVLPCGRDRLWPIQFGPILFWPSWFWPKPILANIFGVMVGPQRVGGQTQKKWGPEVVGRRVGPRIVGPRGPRRVGPKFRAFFPSPATVYYYFFPLLLVFLVEFWLWCEARRPRSRRRSHDSPRAQMCTFQGSGLQKHHQNSTKRTPREGENNKNCGGRGKNCGGRGEKRAKFWVRRRGSGGGALNTPTAHTTTTTTTQKHSTQQHTNTQTHNTQHTHNKQAKTNNTEH